MLHLNKGKIHAVTAEVAQIEFTDHVYEWDITNSKESHCPDKLDLCPFLCNICRSNSLSLSIYIFFKN